VPDRRISALSECSSSDDKQTWSNSRSTFSRTSCNAQPTKTYCDQRTNKTYHSSRNIGSKLVNNQVEKHKGFEIVTYSTSCQPAAATVCPPPLSSPWAPKRRPPPSRRQRSSSFPRPTRSHTHRCSRLTRQHGGEQSGLVTIRDHFAQSRKLKGCTHTHIFS